MGSGIRAEIRIAAPRGCPVAETCDTADVTGRIVARSASPEPGKRAIEVAVDAGTTVEDDRMANVVTQARRTLSVRTHPGGWAVPVSTSNGSAVR